MRILIGLVIVFSFSIAYAAESERSVSNTVDPSKICVYDSHFFSEGSVVGVQPESRVLIQCVREKVEVKGTEYSQLTWKILGTTKHQKNLDKK